MRAPLLERRDKIERFRVREEGSLVALRNVLKHRSEASSARKLLELSLNTFHVVSKVEKTEKELPSVPVDRSNGDVPQKLAPPRVTEIDEKGQPDPFLRPRLAVSSNNRRTERAIPPDMPVASASDTTGFWWIITTAGEVSKLGLDEEEKAEDRMKGEIASPQKLEK
ncbi:hypothetical protein NL676_013751 [Syzygium grande]|nr:hypothetical protein NL676_013751 [Syzygium grande]